MTSPSTLITFSFAILAAVVSLPEAAAACPPGSRLSVRNDGTNPVCAVIGVEGLKIRARCIAMPSTGCPLGGVRATTKRAPGRIYCCPG
jgi:hypothetical protein